MSSDDGEHRTRSSTASVHDNSKISSAATQKEISSESQTGSLPTQGGTNQSPDQPEGVADPDLFTPEEGDDTFTSCEKTLLEDDDDDDDVDEEVSVTNPEYNLLLQKFLEQQLRLDEAVHTIQDLQTALDGAAAYQPGFQETSLPKAAVQDIAVNSSHFLLGPDHIAFNQSPSTYDSAVVADLLDTTIPAQLGRTDLKQLLHYVQKDVNNTLASLKRGSKKPPNNMADPPKPREVPPPTLADLDPIKWVTFRNNFQKVNLLNSWEPKRAKLMLQTCMQDAAARAVEHIKFADADSLDDCLDKFAVIFVNPASATLYKTKFKEATRQPQEELILWHTRIREMFLRAYPKVVEVETNEDLKERFVLGLRNRNLSHTIYSAENYPEMTFTELLTRAQNLQGSLLQCQKTYENVHAITAVQAPDESIQVLTRNANANRARLTCFHCDKPGHVISECRLFQRAKERLEKMNATPRPRPGQPPRQTSRPPGQSTSNGPQRQTTARRGQNSRGRGNGRGRPPFRRSLGNLRSDDAVFAMAQLSVDDHWNVDNDLPSEDFPSSTSPSALDHSTPTTSEN